MTLVCASDVAKRSRGRVAFQGVSFSIPHQARILLIAPKDAGKSMLLRILAGREPPSRGRVQRARNLRVALVPQDVASMPGRRASRAVTLADYCSQALAAAMAEEAELARLEADPFRVRLSSAAMERLAPLQESTERGAGGYAARIEEVLAGLGFPRLARQKTLGQLSPAERVRAVLARAILDNPDLLLLDDPTPHLTPETVDWLAGWLREWPGATLIASRDDYLLDRLVEEVWHLSPQGIEIRSPRAGDEWGWSPAA